MRFMDAELLRIFVLESDHVHGDTAHHFLLTAAQTFGVWGGTVFQGTSGFGTSGVVHHPSFLQLPSKLPVVVELVDLPEKIQAFVQAHQEALHQVGLVTTERVQLVDLSGEN